MREDKSTLDVKERLRSLRYFCSAGDLAAQQSKLPAWLKARAGTHGLYLWPVRIAHKLAFADNIASADADDSSTVEWLRSALTSMYGLEAAVHALPRVNPTSRQMRYLLTTLRTVKPYTETVAI